MQVTVEGVDVSVARDQDEDLAEPDHLSFMFGQRLVGLQEIVSEGVPLGNPNKENVDEADIFAKQIDCGQRHQLDID